MRITHLQLYKSPFDSAYINVPSHPVGVREQAGNFTDYLYEWLHEVCNRTDIGTVTAQAFADNIYETILISVRNIEDIRDKNYCVIHFYDESKRFYFIQSYNLLNATTSPTIELHLVKDIWTECYDKAVSERTVFAITQSHLNMIGSDGNCSAEYQNIINDEVAVVPFNKTWTDTVLWCVYKCDPTVNYYTNYQESNSKIGAHAPNFTYGTYQYFYYPLGVVRAGYIEPIAQSYNESASLYLPRVEGSYLLSQQLTCHVPFYYTLGTRDDGRKYIATTDIHYSEIYYLYGTTEYRSLDQWAPDKDNTTKFFYYGSGDTTSVRTYYYHYSCDTGQNGDYYSNTDNLNLSPYMKSYPFHYYTVTMPSGKQYKFTRTSPLASIDIEVTPTDSGGYYRIFTRCCDNQGELAGEAYESYEVIGDIPKSINAYLDFMSRSANSMNEQKRFALESANYRELTGAINGAFTVASGITDIEQGALELIMPTGSNSASSVARAFGKTQEGQANIMRGVASIGLTVAENEMTKKHIKNAYNARLSDLATTTVTRFQPNNQLNSAPYWDLPIITEYHVLNSETNKLYQLNFMKFGTECQRIDDPLLNKRKYINFVKAVNAEYTSIGNRTYQTVFNSILTKGVRQWNIKYYKKPTLDYWVDNEQL